MNRAATAESGDDHERSTARTESQGGESVPLRKPFVPVGDPVIRAALRAEIANTLPSHRVIDEVATGISRMDVIALGDRLVGFEIKSWRDTLKRLEQQVYDYSRVCDHCAAVATIRHMDEIEERVPWWWGLLLVEQQDDDTVKLFPSRRMMQNPHIDVRRSTHLLWRDEMLVLIAEHSVQARVASKSRAVIADTLHANVPLPALRASVLRTLRARENWHPERDSVLAVDRSRSCPNSALADAKRCLTLS